MAEPDVRIERETAMVIVRLERPEQANKLTIESMAGLARALRTACLGPECRAVVLTGSGGFFCGGGDLGDFRRQSAMDIRKFGEHFIELHSAIAGLPLPVIAAVNGDALGGGLSLVEACDLAVAGESARFGVPEVMAGLAPMMALAGVTRVLSRKGVMELALLGGLIDAKRACEMGFVNSVVPDDQVLSRAMELAKRLSGLNPTALAMCKKLYREADSLPYRRQIECGLDTLISLLKSEDAAEALSAREEGRRPVWKGK